MNNVWCAGGGDILVGTPDGWQDTHGEPCGWTGERFTGPAYYHATHPRASVSPTAKPCPRCGGQVKLIEGDSD
jgi:hypothetical protein